MLRAVWPRHRLDVPEEIVMAEIRLQNLAHSYNSQPQGAADYAIREMDHVWEQGGDRKSVV